MAGYDFANLSQNSTRSEKVQLSERREASHIPSSVVLSPSTLISIKRPSRSQRQTLSASDSWSVLVSGKPVIVAATSAVWYSTIDPTMTLLYGSRMWSGPLLKKRSAEA